MGANPFLKDPTAYSRDYDIPGNYTRIITKHLSTKYNKPVEVIRPWVEKKIEDKKMIKDPTLDVLRRGKNQDRYRTKTTLLTYLRWVETNDLVMGPNMVAYNNVKDKVSYVGEFILGNLTKRSKTKKLMAEYYAQSNYHMASQMNLLQANYKLFNNSISGATSSPHNSLYFASSHTTLTSVCRSCTSFANASNEKLFASNRTYFTLEDAVANISDIASNAPISDIQKTMMKYGLTVPTVEYVTEQVMKTLRLYNYRGLAKMTDDVREALVGLRPYELAAFSFIADLNAFKDFNSEFLRKFTEGFLTKPTKPHPTPEKVIDEAYEDITILTSQLNSEYTRGTSIKEIKKTDKVTFGLYAAHVKSISDHLDEHKDFIHAFLSTHTMPQHLHSVPLMTRKVVVGSDTDSSIFSVESMVDWYEGDTDFTVQSEKTASIFAFIATQIVANSMASLSGQMSVRKDQFFRIGMKSEYFMPVLSLNNAQKHYVYLEAVKEGTVFETPKLAVRGVGYKNSRVPTEVMDLTNDWYKECLMKTYRNERLTVEQVMALPAYIEHCIKDSITACKPDLYIAAKVKQKSGYKKPLSSAWGYIDLWNHVFADKYGAVNELPCTGVKVNVKLNNRRVVEGFAQHLGGEMGENLISWCKSNNKWKFGMLIIPQHMVLTGKIPEEIIPYVDVDKVLNSMTTQFYNFMSTYGIFRGNKRNGDWVSDYMSKEESYSQSFVDLSKIASKLTIVSDEEDLEDDEEMEAA